MEELVIYGLKFLYGLQEIVGKRHNKKIIEIFKEIGHGWVKDDETAWCAAIHNYILMKCGYDYTGKLNARSFENFGEELNEPQFGCTVVFWRVSRSSGYGHVGFFIREDDDSVWVLGGNQSNEYNISKYSKQKLLTYRNIKKK